jgi:phosphatidylserine/phosphatidylglycerophosphate/cardiolipin synthase-like enzyme
VHNKFALEVNSAGQATRVLTGSLNWTVTGLCTQLNNTLIIERPAIAARYLKQWHALVAADNDMPADLKAANAQWTQDGPVALAFAATPKEEDFAPVLAALAAAKQAIFFLMFMPGQSPLLQSALQQSAKACGPFVRGIVSTVTQSKSGTITHQGAQVIMDGVTQKTDDDVLMPEGISEANRPTWAYDEFNRKAFFGAHLMAIVHSKAIVIDPFSDDCVVVTGSHNFSDSASEKNDENIVVIKGDKALAQAYAVHIQGVYDGYAWRAFLDNDGKPDTIYQGLTNWKPGGSHARELDFWVDA